MAKKAEDPNQKQSFPRELLDQSPSERLAYFKAYTVAHPFLQRAKKEIWDALQEPGGALMVFIVGPTGVGKTTLWEHIDQRLTEAAQPRMLQDPDHMPVINLYAMAPSSRQFRWPDFYTRALMAVSEPLISLAALTEVLPLRGLTRSRLAWCPLCYEEWQANEQIVYDPLLWKFREISLCVCHGVRLQTTCPNCARSQPHLAWRSRPGYCAFCAWPLFGEQVERQKLIDPETTAFIWQQWVTETLGTLVAQLSSIQDCPRRERIRLAANHTVERLADGNIAAFARTLDLSRNTVENWCQGKRIPEMDMLLRLCYRLNLSLDDVLFQGAETLLPRLQDPIPEAHFQPRKRTAINKERIFRLLEEAAVSTEDPPPSLQEVGQQLGYQPTILYKINQVACHAIAERFTAYRSQLREKRLQGYREEIEQIALLLQAEKVALTRKHITRYLAQPAILRDPKVRQLLREVCHEVEAAGVRARKPAGKDREEERR
jgi:transcriptional regulator with XRE-family HTH domain